jgi:hypothetical protein
MAIMRQVDIEAWAYRLIGEAEVKRRVEDNRAELKANWPEAKEIARQVAGHANAAYGEPVLWLFGVDEHSGVVPYQSRNMADWQPQLEAEFDGIMPSMQHFALRWNDAPFEAIVFRTDAPPYVVKNPKRGKVDAGPFEFEVPWRAGRTRSARRAELILMLRPVWQTPTFESLGTRIQLLSTRELLLSGHLYVEAPDQRRVLVRSVSASVDFGQFSTEFTEVQPDPAGPDPDVIHTRSHLRVDGAGKMVFQGRTTISAIPDLPSHVVLTLQFRIAGIPRPVSVPIVVPQAQLDGSTSHAIGLWKAGEQ